MHRKGRWILLDGQVTACKDRGAGGNHSPKHTGRQFFKAERYGICIVFPENIKFITVIFISKKAAGRGWIGCRAAEITAKIIF